MGGSRITDDGRFSASLSRPRRRLISARWISITRWLSAGGSTFASPVGGRWGTVLARAAISSKPCLRAIFSTASRSWAVVRDFFSSVRRSLISFSSDTFSCGGGRRESRNKNTSNTVQQTSQTTIVKLAKVQCLLPRYSLVCLSFIPGSLAKSRKSLAHSIATLKIQCIRSHSRC